MNALANMPGPPGEDLLNDPIYARARRIARLVQGSQVLEASALDEAGYARLIEATVQMLRAADARKMSA